MGAESHDVSILPDASGRVDASSNALGVQGQWHVFADSLGLDGSPPGVCQAAGHADSECSIATTPDAALPGFANQGGRMCTTGSTAVVLAVDGELDYLDMWGIGIALSLSDAGDGTTAGTFDAKAQGVVGISFDIDSLPEAGLRVSFPTPADRPPLGPSYWGAAESFPASPVQVGTNVVLFNEVQSPEPLPQPLDQTQIQEVGFLVPSNPALRTDFGYCISNLKLLLE